MKRLLWTGSILFLAFIIVPIVNAEPPEIHCKHFIYGYPLGTPESNDLIIRDLYALSSNDTTKFSDWVSYYLTPHETTGTLDLKRKWHNDPWLSENETLEGTPKSKDDYKGAYGEHKYERGHLAPLASFKGSKYASQVNYYSNIVPQKKNLNGGPWKTLEDKVRKLVDRYRHAWVMTGPLYEEPMPPLPKVDEEHKVPSGFWKIVAVKDSSTLRLAAFIMNQDVESDSPSGNLSSLLECFFLNSSVTWTERTVKVFISST